MDSKGQEENFRHMEQLIAPLTMPVLLSVGNHETPYNADFTPAYNMSSLNNYFDSQKRINGTNKILYSFDIGKWHFVVWPDPLRRNFWSTHPHYFDWLEQDLELNHDKSVIFLQHIPLHPIGIDPLTSYVESISVKRLLLDILTKHGNVKYIFSGHVHIPLKASVKTAVNYKGIDMINLPAAGYRPRAFGEQDYFGGPEQGICIIDVSNEDVTVQFQQVTKEWFTYPKKFEKFDDAKYTLWFNQPWELPLQSNVVNGDFTNQLEYWHQRYVYHENVNPSNICDVAETSSGEMALYLYSRSRDYNAPGQDRLPQHINKIAQAVSVKNMQSPVINLNLLPELGRYDKTSLNGFFLWLSCYNQSQHVTNLVYSIGKIYGGITKSFELIEKPPTYYFDIPAIIGKWNKSVIPFGNDFTSANTDQLTFEQLHAERVIISMGTWTVNDGINQEAGIFIKNIELIDDSTNFHLSKLKNNKDIWHPRINHIAGDHQYVSQNSIYPKKLR